MEVHHCNQILHYHKHIILDSNRLYWCWLDIWLEIYGFGIHIMKPGAKYSATKYDKYNGNLGNC